MKIETKKFKEWYMSSKLFGVWFPNGVNQDVLMKYVKKGYLAGYKQALRDVENEKH